MLLEFINVKFLFSFLIFFKTFSPPLDSLIYDDLLSLIDLFEAAYNASLILKEMGEYERALNEAKRALTYKNEKSIKAMLYINYARLLYANNDVISAINYIKKALSI